MRVFRNKDLRRWCEDALEYYFQILNSTSSKNGAKWLKADRDRCVAYQNALLNQYKIADSREELDQPYTNPREFTVVPFPVVPEKLPNRSVRDYLEMLHDLYEEVRNSQSAEWSRGVSEADKGRYESMHSETMAQIASYAEPVVDLPEVPPVIENGNSAR